MTTKTEGQPEGEVKIQPEGEIKMEAQQGVENKMNPQIRIICIPKDGKCKAYCNALLYGTIAIDGIRVTEGKYGLFAQMPQHLRVDRTFRDTVYPITQEAYNELKSAIIGAYKQYVEQVQNPNLQMQAAAKQLAESEDQGHEEPSQYVPWEEIRFL